jgi:hypothetical protein
MIIHPLIIKIISVSKPKCQSKSERPAIRHWYIILNAMDL